MSKWDRFSSWATIAILLYLVLMPPVCTRNSSEPNHQETDAVSNALTVNYTFLGTASSHTFRISQGQDETEDAYNIRKLLWQNKCISFVEDELGCTVTSWSW